MRELAVFAHRERVFYPELTKYGVPPKFAEGWDIVITNPDGTVKARWPHWRESSTRPKKSDRHITLNCYRYQLRWLPDQPNGRKRGAA